MKSFRKIGFAVAACLLSGAVTAYAAGLFNNFPLVGGAAYSCGSVNGVSNCTVPAGPTIITGNETIPADTNVGTTTPNTVLLQPRSLGAGPYAYNAPLTGASITMTAQQRRLVLEPAGTIAALTVVFPAATTLIDGQMISLCSTQIVTALTITPGTGTTVSNTVTALAVPVATGAASCPEWVYRQANTNWYRVQ